MTPAEGPDREPEPAEAQAGVPGREGRADPEALLHEAEREARGKLTIFLGAVAGVGKTYAMLEAAHARLAEGVDVVAGYVETHGRAETEALLRGLPLVPRRVVLYRGVRLEEMDLDAILARRPQLVLVDELAHTNAPGSRHARRYQDVLELLDAGIDVYTTLNIQHVESLNDTVERITGVRVRETVPDQILDEADQVEVVDLPPEDLLQRLREGKVYVPEQAERAVRHFFRPGNLNALRELTLRRAADRVDREMREYMRRHLISGPWPARERIVVGVSPSPSSAFLVRTARHLAAALRAEWIVATVEVPGEEDDPEGKKELKRALKLASELGAEVVRLEGEDPAQELLALARFRNATTLVLGRSRRPLLERLLRPSVTDRVLAGGEGLGVYVLRPPTAGPRGARRRRLRGGHLGEQAGGYALALLGVLAVTALVKSAGGWIDPVNTALLYLLPVFLVASRWGLAPAITGALLGVLAFDYYFVNPVGAFTVADSRYLFTLAVFMAVASITSSLASRLRWRAQVAREREERNRTLYSLGREISANFGLEQVAAVIARRVAETFESRVAVLTPGRDGRLALCASFPSGYLPEERERAVASWAFEHRQMAGLGTETLSGAGALYVPLVTRHGAVGLIALAPRPGPETGRASVPPAAMPESRRLLEAFAGLAAVALERERLAEEAQAARALEASARLHSALLDALAHELRTPLSSILSASSELLAEEERYTPEARRQLLGNLVESAERMNRLIENLLNMARLEGGALRLHLDWSDVGELIGSALGHMSESLAGRPVRVRVAEGLPLLRLDFALMQQVLVNVLDNAVKYSPPGSEIDVEASRVDGHVEIRVADRGPGIPPELTERIFERFYRLQEPRHERGIGLGLSVARQLVEAHGGRIRAGNRPGGGGLITITLPVEAPPVTAPPPEPHPGAEPA
ncbi:MAG: sensor histidine kinase KdpD [Clostridia bacterium]|nr:sensor histidine kinase KdpD [Clostridia bacterium]